MRYRKFEGEVGILIIKKERKKEREKKRTICFYFNFVYLKVGHLWKGALLFNKSGKYMMDEVPLN